MLTLDELRRVLGRPELSDEELADILDALVCLARVAVEEYVRERRGRASRRKR